AASLLTCAADPRHLHSFPTRRSSDLARREDQRVRAQHGAQRLGGSRHPVRAGGGGVVCGKRGVGGGQPVKDFGVETASPAEQVRSEEHTSELQSPCNLVCRLLLEKKK